MSIEWEDDEPERQPLKRGTLLHQGAYSIERVLGVGGFALTYLAHQGRWNFPVCIKEFFPTGSWRGSDGMEVEGGTRDRVERGLQAFDDEGATLSRFKHPGIVRVLGSFRENKTAYLVQELLDGMTLGDGQFLAGTMKQKSILAVAQQLGQALLMVHAAGLVHSDLKPENIFLTREGRYVLLDFGLTRGFLSQAGSERGARGLSQGFAPPEQYRGEPLGPATDVYGFAATLYALAMGSPPPDAPCRLQGQEIPPMKARNSTIGSKVEKALRQALELDPRRRTPGIREFLHQLGLDSTPRAISYRPPEFQLRASQKGHTSGVTAVTLDVRRRRLFSAGRDGSIRCWSWPELRLLATSNVQNQSISALALSRDGNYLVSGTEAGLVRLEPADFSHPGVVLVQENAGITQLEFHRDLVAASLVDGRCCLMGPSLAQPVVWVAHAGPANTLAFQPEGSYLVTGGDDAKIRFWELPEPQVFYELEGHKKGIQRLRFSSDGTTLLSSSSDQVVRFWDLFQHEMVRELYGHQAVVLDAQGGCLPNLVLTLAGDHVLRGFHLSSARLAFSSEVKNERPRAMVADPQHPFVGLAGGDGSLYVWEYSENPGESQWANFRADEASVGEVPTGPDPWLGSRLGPYQLVDVIKRGGLATIYKGVCQESGREVAIKTLRPEYLEPEFHRRFGREIKLSMKLKHPNVVRTLDWGQQDQITYLVFEYVPGVALSHWMGSKGMDLARLVPILGQVIDGLAYAHSLGVVHRNLKPENILIQPDHVVKLVDFGLARDQSVETVTQVGRVVGTPEYMAPEQVLRQPGRKELSVSTDQYALGILLFEALTGRRPFEWDDPVKLIEMHIQASPPSLRSFRPDLPEALDKVIGTMLKKNVEDRFPSISEAGEALLAALQA